MISREAKIHRSTGRNLGLGSRLLAPISNQSKALKDLIALATDTGTAKLKPEALMAALLVAATVVRIVDQLVRPAMKPGVPCPAPPYP